MTRPPRAGEHQPTQRATRHTDVATGRVQREPRHLRIACSRPVLTQPIVVEPSEGFCVLSRDGGNEPALDVHATKRQQPLRVDCGCPSHVTGRPVWRVKLTRRSGMAALCPTPVMRSRHRNTGTRPRPDLQDCCLLCRKPVKIARRTGSRRSAGIRRGTQSWCRLTGGSLSSSRI